MSLVIFASVLAAIAVGVVFYLVLSYKPVTQDMVLQEKLTDSFSSSAIGLADIFVSKKKRDSVVMKLSVVGLKLRPAEWNIIRLGLALGVGALGVVFSGFWMGVIGVIVGFVVATMWLRVKVNKTRRRFDNMLADTLQIIAGGLRSGMSLKSSLQIIASDGQEPIRSEIQRVLGRERFGISLEDGLDEIADRMQSKAFQWVALTIRVQKEVGGNLSEILTTTTELLRERAHLIGHVRTLSAEGRWSAYILMCLPFVVTTVLVLIRPAYLTPLWTTFMGQVGVGVGLIMLVVGYFWMKAVVKVEV
jgi:tight adherence protein B